MKKTIIAAVFGAFVTAAFAFQPKVPDAATQQQTQKQKKHKHEDTVSMENKGAQGIGRDSIIKKQPMPTIPPSPFPLPDSIPPKK
jgi:hypothetical protein